jgi:hypothetical protein
MHVAALTGAGQDGADARERPPETAITAMKAFIVSMPDGGLYFSEKFYAFRRTLFDST